MYTTFIKDYDRAITNIRERTRQYFSKYNMKSAILGVSGGIDSALTAVLIRNVCDELNIPLIGRILPIQSNKPEEIYRARKIAECFCYSYKEVDLANDFIMFRNGNVWNGDSDDDHKNRVRAGNIKARMRMIHLYDAAAKHCGLVLSTDNLSEAMIGYFTLHGDHNDFGPIQNLWKTEVFKMARVFEHDFRNIQEIRKADALWACIEADPTPGLGITDRDMDELGADSYEEVDEILIKKLKNEYVDHPVIKKHMDTEWKRNWPVYISREEILQ